ncbi:hypothetical protein EDF75_2360 [Raoultella sp. BIGb0149]|uniref:hypothetical protein n=1 Tax=Raoultella sp. BIGb0149 TaxID=2485116 RepID=UPI00105B8C0F|nr:hypothetical protein [Raoultella sp. BIGb0149]TDQ25219.1 hypothetical protein EDF75_2360 [Raoultella sp. BIGb0149]
MSNSLLLVEYDQSLDGKLLENTAHIIEKAFIDQRLLKEIRDTWDFNLTVMYEEEGSDEQIEIESLGDDAINDIYDYFFEAFKRLIIKENEKITLSSKDKLTDISADNKNLDFTFNDIEKFKTLANLISILKLKIDNYQGVKNVFLKVG